MPLRALLLVDDQPDGTFAPRPSSSLAPSRLHSNNVSPASTSTARWPSPPPRNRQFHASDGQDRGPGPPKQPHLAPSRPQSIFRSPVSSTANSPRSSLALSGVDRKSVRFDYEQSSRFQRSVAQIAYEDTPRNSILFEVDPIRCVVMASRDSDALAHVRNPVL